MNNLIIMKNNKEGNKTLIILPSGICGKEYMVILNSMKDKIKKAKYDILIRKTSNIIIL